MTGLPQSERGVRGFLERLLGWSNSIAVDLAIQAFGLAADGLAALVLGGHEDLVPIAWSLHRRAFGPVRPFIVCDPRRGNVSASVRSPANYVSCARGFLAARGGTLCVRARRLPADFAATVALLRRAGDLMLVICIDGDGEASPLLVRPAPIRLPPLARRTDELDRIIDEYGCDAVSEFGGTMPALTDHERAWVREHAATSLCEIEKATLRLVAIRAARNMSTAAAHLGMAPVSLSRWIARRHLPPVHQ